MHCNSVWGLCLRWAQAPFNFDTTCVEVACATSLQLAAKWFLTSAQVGQMLDFGLPTNLVGGRFFIPDKLSGSWFWKFCPTWAELFFWIFSWNASKNAFLVGYHWERFFLWALPKTQIPSATTWRNILKNCRRRTHKKFGFPGYHLKTTMDKKRFSPAPLESKFFCARCECESFFWRYMKKGFQKPLIIRS